MKYYALAQDLPAGTFPGNLDAILVDKLYPSAFENGYNVYPWYARKPDDISTVFNDRMNLLINSVNRKFELARISSEIFVCSTRFLRACKDLNVKIIDHEKIETKFPKAKTPPHEYNAIIFKKFDIEFAANKQSALIYRNNRARRIKKLLVSDEFKEHLFIFKNMEGTSDTLICSETFRSHIQKLEGVEFIDVETAEWPRVKAI